MGDYIRLISYIYTYDRGVKAKNAGFAKIESRNNICKVSISLRIADELMNEVEDNYLEVYFFVRREGKPQKIHIGRIKINNGCSVFKARLVSDNIGGSGVPIESVAGIFVCSKSFVQSSNYMHIVYASEWDDNPIVTTEFVDEKNELKKIFELDYNVEKEELQIAEIERVQDVEPQDVEPQNVATEVIEIDEPERVEIAEEMEPPKCSPGPADYFRMLCGCYPTVKVDEIEGECLRITPHDINYLPKRYWHLSNYSFLLHGFYYYKYLLFCEKKVNNENRYMVGVPGIFHQKEQKVARMFGFTEFEGDMSKNFGYWCMYL